jgi:uncharacterized membrane protein YdjX (TVP38/TMEM64 family)
LKPRPALAAAVLLLALPALASAATDVGGSAEQARAWFAALLQNASVHPEPLNLAGIVTLVAVLPFIMLPMSVLCLLAAAALPPLVAWPVIMAGLVLNTGLAWGLARTVIGARLERWLERKGGKLARIRRGARESGLKWAILCRYIPAPYVAQPMILASAGVGLGTTLLGSAIGMFPWSIAYLWVAHAGREGSLRSLGIAGLVLVAVYGLAAFVRLRYAGPDGEPSPLTPRRADRPLVTLYTVPGHELSDEAREELGGLRDRLGFEVEETSLGEGAAAALREAYEDHAPVAFFDGHKLFSFKMDENVLTVRLAEWRGREGKA